MDISGAQLNSAAISAYNAQLQTAPQPQGGATASTSDNERQSSTEVTLSQEGRQRASQDQAPAQPTQPNVSTVVKAPVQPSASQQTQDDSSSSNDNADNQAAVQAQAAELQRQQSQAALANASTYTARVAAQSYSSVSSF